MSRVASVGEKFRSTVARVVVLRHVSHKLSSQFLGFDEVSFHTVVALLARGLIASSHDYLLMFTSARGRKGACTNFGPAAAQPFDERPSLQRLRC